jgi:ribosomal protein L31
MSRPEMSLLRSILLRQNCREISYVLLFIYYIREWRQGPIIYWSLNGERFRAPRDTFTKNFILPTAMYVQVLYICAACKTTSEHIYSSQRLFHIDIDIDIDIHRAFTGRSPSPLHSIKYIKLSNRSTTTLHTSTLSLISDSLIIRVTCKPIH